MKYIFLIFMLLVSISAFTANQNKNTQSKMNTPTAMPKDDQATQLDDLMRGEMAAMKAYDQALVDIKEEKQRGKLQAIREDHEKAVSVMSKYVAGKPSLLEDTQKSGPWGTFAKTWTKGRGLTGNKGALKALRQGEEHGINEYEEALEDKSIDPELKNQIRTELLPNQKKHIETLKTLI
jgi:demethoxyubiquinone hydroxylase (CLK1/Coq7/Cat5 family)